MLLLYSIISILAGATVVLGRILNARLAEKIGTIQATVINYVVGIFFSVLILLIAGRGFHLVRPETAIPVWAYLGGIMGVIIIMVSNYTTPRVPAFYLTLLVFLGQLALGLAIDWWISKEFSYLKVIGSLFVIGGFTYNLLLDRKPVKK